MFLLLLVLAGFAAGGCASTESENMSERPWSSPQTWETGLPSGMMDQRR
ncbi:MAG: hypothetical protein WCQ21_19400 [Verrucomicrobiota bacterium]|jgi:hypothetical protein